MDLKITCLVENRASGRGTLGEHGLSFLIEWRGKRFLFDTGQGYVLLHNAEQLGIDVINLDGLIISHGHFDHTGGVEELLKRVKGTLPIYLHPAALGAKYLKVKNGTMEQIGFGLTEDRLQELGGALIYNHEPLQVMPGLWLTGEIPRIIPFETPEPRFFCQQGEWVKQDLIPDDQAVVIETSKGLVVVLGCAHTGPINTLEWVKRFTGKDQIYAVIGGTHLMAVSEERINKTGQEFLERGIEEVGVCHCTGFSATTRLASLMGDRLFQVEVGTVLSY